MPVATPGSQRAANEGSTCAPPDGAISVSIWKRDVASGFTPSSWQLEACVLHGAE